MVFSLDEMDVFQYILYIYLRHFCWNKLKLLVYRKAWNMAKSLMGRKIISNIIVQNERVA